MVVNGFEFFAFWLTGYRGHMLAGGGARFGVEMGGGGRGIGVAEIPLRVHVHPNCICVCIYIYI